MVSLVKNLFTHSSLDKNSQDLQAAIRSHDVQRVMQYWNAHSAKTPLPNGTPPLHYAIRLGDRNVVQAMLNTPYTDRDAKDNQGLSPSDHAFLQGQPEMMAAVLGDSVLQLSEQIKKKFTKKTLSLLQEIIDKPPSQQFDDAVFLELPSVHQAAARDVAELQFFNQKELDSVSQKSALTPLHVAILSGNIDTTKWLLARNCQQNLRAGASRFSLLHLAVLTGDAAMVKYLLEALKDKGLVNAASLEGYTPLHLAMLEERAEIAHILMQHGASLLTDTWKPAGEVVTPFDLMLLCGRLRVNTRDSLRLQKSDMFLFGCIVLPLILQICAPQVMNNSVVAFSMASVLMLNRLTQVYTAYKILFEQCQSWDQKIGTFTLLALRYSGIGRLTIPCFDLFHQLLMTYVIGTRILKNFAVCWKNLHLETYRPLRNAIVHGVIGGGSVYTLCQELWAVQQAVTQEFESRQIQKCVWDESNSVSQKRETDLRNCQLDCQRQHPNLKSQARMLCLGRCAADQPSQAEQQKLLWGIESTCEEKYDTQLKSLVQACALKEDKQFVECSASLDRLNPDKLYHAKLILSLGKGQDDKARYRDLMRRVHPDRSELDRTVSSLALSARDTVKKSAAEAASETVKLSKPRTAGAFPFGVGRPRNTGKAGPALQ